MQKNLEKLCVSSPYAVDYVVMKLINNTSKKPPSKTVKSSWLKPCSYADTVLTEIYDVNNSNIAGDNVEINMILDTSAKTLATGVKLLKYFCFNRERDADYCAVALKVNSVNIRRKNRRKNRRALKKKVTLPYISTFGQLLDVFMFFRYLDYVNIDEVVNTLCSYNVKFDRLANFPSSYNTYMMGAPLYHAFIKKNIMQLYTKIIKQDDTVAKLFFKTEVGLTSVSVDGNVGFYYMLLSCKIPCYNSIVSKFLGHVVEKFKLENVKLLEKTTTSLPALTCQVKYYVKKNTRIPPCTIDKSYSRIMTLDDAIVQFICECTLRNRQVAC